LQDIQALPATANPRPKAGGIPGPLGMHGTGASGIAIATNMMDGDPQRLAARSRTELGHYLGRSTPAKRTGSVYDALADTPECRSDRMPVANGLDVGDCSGAGADNLMSGRRRWARSSRPISKRC